MAELKATVVRLTIEEHPNADAIEIARVDGYMSIVQKGVFKTGDLAVYIPEQSVLKPWLIKVLGLEGRLAGNAQNRVKAIKLRGILSQGLILPIIGKNSAFHGACTHAVTNDSCTMGVTKGDDVTEFLGITKYVPRIPTHMEGEVFAAFGYTLKYDIENIKNHPDVFTDDEIVLVTEKLHGTWCCFGYHPAVDHAVVLSKGMSDKGLAFKLNKANEFNLYAMTYYKYAESLEIAKEFAGDGVPVYLLGEIYGRGVQDLHYGSTEPQFRLFDIYIGSPGYGQYISAAVLQQLSLKKFGIECVPSLYWGVFNEELIEELTSGPETVSGLNANMREGIVIRPESERRHDAIGRVILKSVSEKYLLRKGEVTEYN